MQHFAQTSFGTVSFNTVSFNKAAKYLLVALGLTAIMQSNVIASESVFSTTLRLLKPITLTQNKDLTFDEVIAGSNQSLTTSPEDSKAVSFTAGGEPNSAVTASIVENSVTLISGLGEDSTTKITMDTFTMGGDLTIAGNGVFDANGVLSDLRVGATVHIEGEDQPGDYTATATFRVVYN